MADHFIIVPSSSAEFVSGFAPPPEAMEDSLEIFRIPRESVESLALTLETTEGVHDAS